MNPVILRRFFQTCPPIIGFNFRPQVTSGDGSEARNAIAEEVLTLVRRSKILPFMIFDTLKSTKQPTASEAPVSPLCKTCPVVKIAPKSTVECPMMRCPVVKCPVVKIPPKSTAKCPVAKIPPKSVAKCPVVKIPIDKKSG